MSKLKNKLAAALSCAVCVGGIGSKPVVNATLPKFGIISGNSAYKLAKGEGYTAEEIGRITGLGPEWYRMVPDFNAERFKEKSYVITEEYINHSKKSDEDIIEYALYPNMYPNEGAIREEDLPIPEKLLSEIRRELQDEGQTKMLELRDGTPILVKKFSGGHIRWYKLERAGAWITYHTGSGHYEIKSRDVNSDKEALGEKEAYEEGKEMGKKMGIKEGKQIGYGKGYRKGEKQGELAGVLVGGAAGFSIGGVTAILLGLSLDPSFNKK